MGCDRCNQGHGSRILHTGNFSDAAVQAPTIRDIPKPIPLVLQILSLHNTKVVAGARPGENADDLHALSKKYEGRVMIVEMELLDKESVKVGHYKPAPGRIPVLTADSCLRFHC